MVAYKIRKVDLGQSGLHFLEAKLGKGLTLPREVLDRHAVGAFACYTYLPDYVAQGDVLDYEFGGKVQPQPNRNGPHELAKYTRQMRSLGTLMTSAITLFLSQSTQNCCILEGHLPRKSDKFTENVLSERIMLFFGEEVYYALDHEASEQRIERGLALSDSFLRLGFLVQDFPHDISEKINDSVDADFIGAIASHVAGVFVNAYDGESNVIAHRKTLQLEVWE
jgi:hypothetical protein